MLRFALVLLIGLTPPLQALGLFEEAVGGGEGSEISSVATYELNGMLRGVFYGAQRPETDELYSQTSYGELALKVRTRQGDWGDAFAEMRFRQGQFWGRSEANVDLREAYVNAYLGPFDFRVGHQIIAWGRADGINPTDNLTPHNLLVRSPDEDDRRQGNFLIRSVFNASPWRVEAIWIPQYAPSTLPTNVLPIPEGLQLVEAFDPRNVLKRSEAALRLHLELPAFDASVSYFAGYDPFPGLDLRRSPEAPPQIVRTPYREHVIGADFATTIGKVGLRGEVAYRRPHGDPDRLLYLPRRDLQFVLGADHEFGNLSVLIQYVGHLVFDHRELPPPGPSSPEQMQHLIALRNRQIHDQQEARTHAAMVRIAWNALHETLRLECLGFYNGTLGSWFARPKVSYDLTDALKWTLGGEFYGGPEDTLFGTLDEHLSAVFTELRASF